MGRSGITVLALVTLAGCRESTAPDDLLVTVTIAPASVTHLDTATITVMIANASARPVTIRGSSSCRFGYEVTDSTGAAVSSHLPSICTADIRPITLGPGESDAAAFSWLPLRNVLGLFSPLPPGVYRLRGKSLWTGRWSTAVPVQVGGAGSRAARNAA